MLLLYTVIITTSTASPSTTTAMITYCTSTTTATTTTVTTIGALKTTSALQCSNEIYISCNHVAKYVSLLQVFMLINEIKKYQRVIRSYEAM